MTKSLLPFEKIKRSIHVRKKAASSSKFGCNPNKRPIDGLLDYGIINVDKPSGPTSHQVSAYVQKILGIKRSGHSGTLDPKVTGVLPVALGKSTRIVQILLNAGKEYVGIMHLHKPVDKKKLKEAIDSFVGKIKQLPPIKSSVKRDWRYRKVYYIDILDIEGQDVLLRVGCQAGTYIRKLFHDLGQKLGVGAHMAELRRTKAGGFAEDTAYTLQDLTDAFWYYKNEGNDKYLRKIIRPFEDAVNHLPKVWILDSTVGSICHGMNLAVPGIAKAESDIQVDETVAMMTLKDELVAIGPAKMVSKDMVKAGKGIAVVTSKVFMNSGIYPKIPRNP